MVLPDHVKVGRTEGWSILTITVGDTVLVVRKTRAKKKGHH